MRKINLPRLLFSLFISLFFVVFIFLNLFISTSKVYANNILFEDNFESGLGKWEAVRGNIGDWSIQNASAGATVYSGIIEIVPKSEFWNEEWGDYIFEVDMLPKEGVDRNLSFRFQALDKWYEIHHTVDTYGWFGIALDRVYPNQGKHLAFVRAYDTYFPGENRPIENNKLCHFKIVILEENIKVFMREENKEEKLIFDYEDTGTPLRRGKIGLKIGTGAVSPSEVWFDNVVVTSLEVTPTPTPTATPTPTPTPSPTPSPTPTPTPIPPVVVLPGLGASWNREKILFGTEVPQSAWKIPPWVPHYNNLIGALEDAGYEKNESLFIFAYDWTKPVNLIADDLKDYIDNVVDPPAGVKIDLVGHSLGGLVGRAYIQENPGNHKIDNLITIGSPHKGAPQTYRAWEGGDLHDLMPQPWRVLTELLLAVRGRDYPNKVQALRNLAPVLRDLLPIFDYLKWNRNNQVIPEPSLPAVSRNLWLASIGIPQELLDLASTVVGIIGDTPRWLRLIPRDRTDEILGRWSIGKPVGQENETGDRTVLASSAELSGANIVSLSQDHDGLVQRQEGINTTLELLGIEGAGLGVAQMTPETQILVFVLTTMDNLQVTDPNGAIFAPVEDNIIVLPNPLAGNYKAHVVGQSPGSYRLLIGQLTNDQDVWSEYQGTTAPGETDTYNIPVDPTLTTTPSYLLKLINDKLTKLISGIDGYEINPVIKAKIKAKLLKISAELKPVPILLHFGKNEKADKFVQKAILTNSGVIKFAEQKGVNSLLPSLRELRDLLGQLHDLL